MVALTDSTDLVEIARKVLEAVQKTAPRVELEIVKVENVDDRKGPNKFMGVSFEITYCNIGRRDRNTAKTSYKFPKNGRPNLRPEFMTRNLFNEMRRKGSPETKAYLDSIAERLSISKGSPIDV